MAARDIFTIGDPLDERVDRSSERSEWVENTYVPNEAQSNTYVSMNFSMNKIRWLLFVTVAAFSILGFRIGYLQVAKGDEYRSAAEENRIRIYDIKAPRGILYDKNGAVLARNIPNFTMNIIPGDLPANSTERIKLFWPFAQVLGISVDEIMAKVHELPEHSYQQHEIFKHIDYDQAILLKIHSADTPGVIIQASTFREYMGGDRFSHALGYMGKITESEKERYSSYAFDDYVGKSGVELSYESILHGENGLKQVEVDSFGKESKVITESEPVHGTNLTLTLDKDIQDALGEALADMVERTPSATGGAAIAMDPNNGEVLALLSYPYFSNNDFTVGLTTSEYQDITNAENKPLFNRAVSAEYPSGSTIKPVVALAGLAEGVITSHTTINSTGGIRIGQWFFPDWKAGGHGQTDVKKAIAESVNTFFYAIGGGYEDIEGLGVDRIKQYLELFGLNALLGIDIPGEQTGFLPTKQWKEDTKNERWYIGDTYHLSIGQGDILVTPLQVAAYTATIANGGTLYQPRVIKKMSKSNDETETEVPPTIIRDNFISAKHFEIVRQGLRDGVLYGSSRALNALPFSVAGKTGTAQFGNKGHTHAWFTSFAPYEDPEIVVTVVIEGGGEGHAAALPVARAGLEAWFEHYKQ